MGLDKNSRINYGYKYDPLVGKWTREVKPLRSFNIAGTAPVGSSVSQAIASGSVAGNREILITSIILTSTDSDGVFDITAGTATLFQIIVPPDDPIIMVTGADAPFARVGGTTVITVDAGASAVASGSLSVSIAGIVLPQAHVLETK